MVVGLMEYLISPVAKPRMTKRDTWLKRPATSKYWAFKDEVRLLGIKVPLCGAHITFHMPMPNSWSRAKREKMVCRPHQVKPDADNLVKALFDALYENDAGIWDFRVTKVWSDKGKIEVKCGG